MSSTRTDDGLRASCNKLIKHRHRCAPVIAGDAGLRSSSGDQLFWSEATVRSRHRKLPAETVWEVAGGFPIEGGRRDGFRVPYELGLSQAHVHPADIRPGRRLRRERTARLQTARPAWSAGPEDGTDGGRPRARGGRQDAGLPGP